MNKNFSQLNPAWMITGAELTEWAQVKDANRPAFTGSPKWLKYVGFLEEKLCQFGVVEVTKNRWPFER